VRKRGGNTTVVMAVKKLKKNSLGLGYHHTGPPRALRNENSVCFVKHWKSGDIERRVALRIENLVANTEHGLLIDGTISFTLLIAARPRWGLGSS
jgi:hypothetical protein